MKKRKYFGRYNSDIGKSVSSKIVRTDSIGIVGYASWIEVHEVHRPYMVGEAGAEVCIANDGYSELAFLPDDENWQMTAIYDERGDIVEWYFDITCKNSVDEEGNPYCDDLYLDAVLMPDGRVLILDEKELVDAFNNGGVNQEDFDLAHRALKKLIDEKVISVEYMVGFCERLKGLF